MKILPMTSANALSEMRFMQELNCYSGYRSTTMDLGSTCFLDILSVLYILQRGD